MGEVMEFGQPQPGATDDATDKVMFVRTSDMEIVTWDRQRIVEALVRETLLDAGSAEKVAAAVEGVIQNSKIEVLTSPLIRELVDAKLIELGFESARRMPTRLGMTVTDWLLDRFPGHLRAGEASLGICRSYGELSPHTQRDQAYTLQAMSACQNVVADFPGTPWEMEAEEIWQEMNAKVARLDMRRATMNDVIRIFGEPVKYLWGNRTFTKNILPETFIMDYPEGFNVVVSPGASIDW